MDFIAMDGLRYSYEVSFDQTRIYHEELLFYPNPESNKLKASRLYTREGNEFVFGPLFTGTKKKVELDLLENQLFLSKAVQNKVEQLNPVFEFFKNHVGLSVFHDTDYDEILLRNLGEFIYNNKEQPITDLIEQFIINSDTGIIGIEAVPEKDVPQIQFPENFPEKEREKLIEEFVKKFQYQILTQHRLYENGKEIGITTLPLKEQSTGTKKFFSLLRLVLVALRDGDLLIVDELDKSLHTEWTQMLINLFHQSETNPQNAQLIFATHDTNLLNSELFGRDQIYMIQKNRFGASELFALSSFTGLRQDTPFEKWYLSGRFGAVPHIYDNLLINQIQKSPIFHE
jgi:AAA15 family ATPase/GTPase